MSDLFIGELITLSIMAFALGMDAFSVGLGMGMVKLRRKQIFYIGFIIGLFHVIMPLGGMAAGNMLSGLLGVLAVYIGGSLLFVLGFKCLWLLLNSQKNDSCRRQGRAYCCLPSASALTASPSV